MTIFQGKMICIPTVLLNFVIGLTVVSPQHFGILRSVMLILQLENLRNFLPSKDSIVVLTRIAWAAIVISAHRLSQGLQVGMLHSLLTFSFL